jgi:hypothetical protein
LRKIADGMERCTELLRSFFLKIGDYQNCVLLRWQFFLRQSLNR